VAPASTPRATRYVAFLRALNVGGHTVKMDALRAHFEALGFDNVSTFIASGNVLFESGETDAAKLERRIEQALHEALGYEVATFLRTEAELAEVAAYEPFPDAEPRDGDTRYVVFLQKPLDAAARERVNQLANDRDLLHLNGRELHWLRRGSLLDSTIADKDWRRAYGRALTTSRNLNTVRRIAAKLSNAAR
jgi:uncharacterized protein (DUF1697 family)